MAPASIGAAAQAAPSLPLGHAGRWLTDTRGRVVILHGINMVYKRPPYYPSAAGFGNDDAAFLQRVGFNAARVGVIWKALEPQPGVYDSAYLGHIAQTVATLARHGIVSLLDFHQDLYNERYQGDGAPDWAVQDGGLPNARLGFPSNYFGNLALQHALDAFFSGAAGPGGVSLQDRFAGAWARVARQFGTSPPVLGYELFNEPFPGTVWQPSAAPTGCPAFDRELTALYNRVDRAIRAVNRRTLVFYEPNLFFNDGVDTQVGPITDRRTGFAFHDYCPFEVVNGSPLGCASSDPTTTRSGDKQAIVRDPAKPPSGSNLVLPTLRALVEPIRR